MIEVKHDSDGKLYYFDRNGNLRWLAEVEIFEGDRIAAAINSLLREILNEDKKCGGGTTEQ